MFPVTWHANGACHGAGVYPRDLVLGTGGFVVTRLHEPTILSRLGLLGSTILNNTDTLHIKHYTIRNTCRYYVMLYMQTPYYSILCRDLYASSISFLIILCFICKLRIIQYDLEHTKRGESPRG